MRRTRAQDDGWGLEQGLIRHGPWICSTSSAALITDRSSEMGLCICPNKQKPLPSQNSPPPTHTHLLHNTTTVHQPLRSDTLPLRLALTRKQTAERQKRNDREGMQLRARWSDKEREGAWRWIGKDSETERERERGSKVSIRGAWSLWTVAARFKAPQKEPSSAMTDSADKRWSMKADRCADSRREALAPAGRVHYCGQTQLSGPNGPSAFLPCHHADVTQREPGPVHPLLHSLQSPNTAFQRWSIPRPFYCTTSFWRGTYQLTGVEINLSQQFSDILTMCKGMQGRAEWRISDR